MTLSLRDDRLEELMDDPDCDPVRLRATLRRFGLVNRLYSGWGRAYRTTLGPYLAGLGRPARVLDLGSGGGDIVRRFAARGRRDALDVHWTGVDPDPRAHDVAESFAAPPGVSFRCTDAATLVREGERYDVVVSNHVLHHLGADLAGFVADSATLSHGIVLHADIARGRMPYALYTVGILPFAPGTFLLTDGLRSIRRSFTARELQVLLDRDAPGEWTVRGLAPFHMLAVGRGRA